MGQRGAGDLIERKRRSVISKSCYVAARIQDACDVAVTVRIRDGALLTVAVGREGRLVRVVRVAISDRRRIGVPINDADCRLI